MSDLGTPLSSGFRQRKNHALANFVLIACVGCIFMSLVTKWGYYDDKTNVRRVEAAQTAVVDSVWHDQKDEAEATISALKNTPSEGVAKARADAVAAKIQTLQNQLDDAEVARDQIPIAHSSNRVAAGQAVTAASMALAEAQSEKVAIAQIRDDLSRLAAARLSLSEANDKIRGNAGRAGSNEGGARQKAGDWVVVRAIRVALHQFLCWLFPLVCFESVAAYRDEKKKEDANRKRRESRDAAMNTVDADFRDVTPSEPERLTANGYYTEQNDAEAEEKDRLQKERDEKTEPPVKPGYRNGSEPGESGEVDRESEDDNG